MNNVVAENKKLSPNVVGPLYEKIDAAKLLLEQQKHSAKKLAAVYEGHSKLTVDALAECNEAVMIATQAFWVLYRRLEELFGALAEYEGEALASQLKETVLGMNNESQQIQSQADVHARAIAKWAINLDGTPRKLG